MPKPRADTVGSIVAHGEYLTMTLVAHPLGAGRGHRWRCSCGDEATRWCTGAHARAQAALRWVDHVQRRHPEAET